MGDRPMSLKDYQTLEHYTVVYSVKRQHFTNLEGYSDENLLSQKSSLSDIICRQSDDAKKNNNYKKEK